MTTKYWPDPTRYDTITTAWAIGVLPNAPLQFTLSSTEQPHWGYLTEASLSINPIYTFIMKIRILQQWVDRIERKKCFFIIGKSHVWELKGDVCSPAFHPGLSPMTSPLKYGPLLMEIPVSRVFIAASEPSVSAARTQTYTDIQAQGAARKSGPPINAVYYSPHFPDTT